MPFTIPALPLQARATNPCPRVSEAEALPAARRGAADDNVIASLTGILREKDARRPHVWVDVNGVGYEVGAPLFTIMRLVIPARRCP